jgi:hypothetical protein
MVTEALVLSLKDGLAVLCSTTSGTGCLCSQATAGQSFLHSRLLWGGYSTEIRRDGIRHGHLEIRVANRRKAGRDSTYPWQTRREAHADIRAGVTVERRVRARHSIRPGAAIKR